MVRIAKRLATALVVPLVLLACAGEPDVKENVDSALEQAKIENVNVEYDREGNVIHLKGRVESEAERARAEEVATTAVGTSGRVLNELTVSGVDDQTADDLDSRIKDTLDRMMDDDPVFRRRDVNFEVNNGVVTVKGEVRNQEEKVRVSEMVRQAPGVRDVANSLEIAPETRSKR